MLEQLGLGVVLSLEDDFTPQANTMLNSFERLQSGADTMVSEIQKNMMNMRNLMMTGFTFKELGEEVENFGHRVNKVFEDMYRGIGDAGAKWETLTNTLRTFYGAQTDATMQKGLELASKTPFEVADVMDSLRSLKAVKVEALKTYDELDQAGKQYKKTFLEYVGDLGAFNPQQGMQGAMYAFRNLLGGNKKSLDQRFDVNSEFVLGESWADDPQKIQEQFVEFVRKLAPNMMKNLEGTFEQLVSNLEDRWTMFKIAVSDNGAFEPMKKTLTYISNKVDDLWDAGVVDNFAKTVGQALGALWKPVDLLAHGIGKVVELFAKFSSAHPMLAKLALGFIGVVGAVTTATGMLLKFSGGILMALSSISILILNLQQMKSTGLGVASALSGVSGTIGKIASSMGLLGLASAGFYFAWNRDIGGVQTKLKSLFNSVTTGWELARQAMRNAGNLNGVMKDYSFKMKIKIPPLAKIFAGKFLKVLAIVKAFWQVFTGHFEDGVMKFSKKDWELYKAVGIDGLVRGMVYARDKLDHFVEGVKEGMTTVVGVVAEFARMVWKPFKAVIDVIEKHIGANPNGLLGKLILGEKGVSLSVADRHVEMARKLGKAVGVVIGSLVGFKVVGKLTGIITKPFKSLLNVLGRVEKKVVGVGAKMKGIFGGGIGNIPRNIGSAVKGTKFYEKQKKTKTGSYIADVTRDTKDLVRRYDRTSHYQKGRAFRDGKFQNLSMKDIDSTYYDYFLQDKLGKGDQVQVKRRSKLGKVLFGETYYKKSANGEREQLGKFGGILNLNRDDRNIENRATDVFSRGTLPRDNTVMGLTHKPKLGDTIGTLRNMKVSGGKAGSYGELLQKQMNEQVRQALSKEQDSLQAHNLMSSRDFTVGKSGGRIGSIMNSEEFSKYKSNVNQKVFADSKQGSLSRLLFGQKLYTVNKDSEGFYNKQIVGRRGGIFRKEEDDGVYKPENKFDTVKSVGRRVGAVGSFLGDTKVGRVAKTVDRYTGKPVRNLAGKAIGGTVGGAKELVGYTKSLIKSPISTLKDTFGNMKTQIAGSSTMQGAKYLKDSVAPKFNQSGFSEKFSKGKDRVLDFGSRASERLASTKVARAGRTVGQYVGNSRVARVTKSVGKSVGSGASMMFGAMMSPAKTLKSTRDWGNKQLARVGLKARIPSTKEGLKGAVKSTKSFLFGSNIKNAKGEVIGRKQGMVSKVGKGAMTVGKGAMRGVGMAGALAMRAMPFIALGGMAMRGISNRGKGVGAKDKQKMGLAKDASSFQTGLKMFSNDLKKLDFKGLWAKFRKEASGSFKIVKDIAKTLFNGLKTELPTIMRDAFTAIKGLASVAWNWIKTDGIKVAVSIGQSLMSLIGKAWEWLGENGGQMFGKVASFVITNVIPSIIRGVIQLGVFIITHIPQVLKGLMSIALGIFRGIYEGVKSIFSGIASFLGSAIKSALAGIGDVLLGALSSLIRAVPIVGDKVADFLHLPVHHGGLWMSDEEHMAVIRKDETVLPPDKSKKLNDMLGNEDRFVTNHRKESDTKKTPTNVDNSIKIDKVEIVVKADKLSQADARKQAQLILREFKKLKTEKGLRNYTDGEDDVVLV